MGVLLAAAHCSSGSPAAPDPSDGESCASNPFVCGSVETCWPVQGDAGLACIPVPAGAGEFAANCEDEVGYATCESGMTCDVVLPAVVGTCTFYCDATHPCPSGDVCAQTRVGGTSGPVISLCRAG